MLCAGDTKNSKQPRFYVEPDLLLYPPKKKNPLRSDSEWVGGGDSRSRTDDPLLAKQVL